MRLSYRIIAPVLFLALAGALPRAAGQASGPATTQSAAPVSVDLSGAMALPTSPGFHQRHCAVTAGDAQFKMTYALFLPPAYFQSDERYPVVIHLHNAMAKGLGGAKLTVEGIAAYWSGDAGRGEVDTPTRINPRRSAKYIGIAPQCPAGYEWWSTPVPQAISALVDELSKTYRIDPDRIYLTGWSYGGTSTWEVGLALPQRFAAIVPISGRASSVTPPQDVKKLTDTGVYLVCGTADKAFLPLCEKMRDALQAAGHPNFIFRTVPNGDHGCYRFIYTDPKFWEWLYAQKRGAPATRPSS